MAPKPKRALTKPHPDVFAAAERLLADVKAGKIKAFGIAFVGPDAPYTGTFSGIDPDDMLSAKLLEAASHELQHVWLHVVNR